MVEEGPIDDKLLLAPAKISVNAEDPLRSEKSIPSRPVFLSLESSSVVVVVVFVVVFTSCFASKAAFLSLRERL